MRSADNAQPHLSWPTPGEASGIARSLLAGLERFREDSGAANAGSIALPKVVDIEAGCAAAFAAGAGGTLMRVLETHMAHASCAWSAVCTLTRLGKAGYCPDEDSGRWGPGAEARAEARRTQLVELGAARPLVDAMNAHPDMPGVQLSCCAFLGSAMVHQPRNVDIIVAAGGIEAIVQAPEWGLHGGGCHPGAGCGRRVRRGGCLSVWRITLHEPPLFSPHARQRQHAGGLQPGAVLGRVAEAGAAGAGAAGGR